MYLLNNILLRNREENPYKLIFKYGMVLYKVNTGSTTAQEIASKEWDVYTSEEEDIGFELDEFAVADNGDIYAVGEWASGTRYQVLKLNGNTFEVILDDSYNHNADMRTAGIDIAIGKDNMPYVFYTTKYSNPFYVVKKYNGSSWKNIGNLSLDSRTGHRKMVDIGLMGNNDMPYISYLIYSTRRSDAVYSRSSQNPLYLKKFNGVSWEWFFNPRLPDGVLVAPHDPIFARDNNDIFHFMDRVNRTIIKYE